MEAEYASKGVAGAGLGLGIAGTALALLQGGGLGGLFGGGWGCNCGTGAMAAGGAALATIAEKDAKIAQLTAELDSDRKLIQVWDNLNTKREATDKEVATLKAAFAAQAAILASITKVVVPNTAVCPGWGNVTITPAAATTTAAATAPAAVAANGAVAR